MTIEQFSQALAARPFRPFTLRTTSGEEYPVRHPEFAMRTPGGRTIVVASGEEASVVLDLLLIDALKYPEPVANPERGEGRPR